MYFNFLLQTREVSIRTGSSMDIFASLGIRTGECVDCGLLDDAERAQDREAQVTG